MADNKKDSKLDNKYVGHESDDTEDTDESGAPEREDPSLKKLMGEGMKKLFTAGISAAFMTEESIRTYLQDLKLPKEVLNLILQNAAKSKEQLMNRVGNEISAMIKKIDFVDEASRFVEGHKFKISAEIEVIKKKDSSES